MICKSLWYRFGRKSDKLEEQTSTYVRRAAYNIQSNSRPGLLYFTPTLTSKGYIESHWNRSGENETDHDPEHPARIYPSNYCPCLEITAGTEANETLYAFISNIAPTVCLPFTS